MNEELKNPDHHWYFCFFSCKKRSSGTRTFYKSIMLSKFREDVLQYFYTSLEIKMLRIKSAKKGFKKLPLRATEASSESWRLFLFLHFVHTLQNIPSGLTTSMFVCSCFQHRLLFVYVSLIAYCNFLFAKKHFFVNTTIYFQLLVYRF
jgi:hypothetical protein